MLTNRFLKFYSTLYFCDKNVVANLRRCQENDCRSNFGLNIRNLCLANDTLDIFECKKNSAKYFPINDCELWRVNFLKEILEIISSNSISGFTNDELNDLLNFVACS